jgi:hypothetical protein
MEDETGGGVKSERPGPLAPGVPTSPDDREILDGYVIPFWPGLESVSGRHQEAGPGRQYGHLPSMATSRDDVSKPADRMLSWR